MSELYCKNITSIKRTLPEGAKLMLGDHLVEGCALKVSSTTDPRPVSEEELLKNRAAAKVFGLDPDDTSTSILFPVGSKVHAETFIIEPGFEVCGGSAEVIHAGYGGEVRFFAPGSKLLSGDFIVNGWVYGPNGERLEAPYQVSSDGYTAGDDGAVISPSGDEAEPYCSLQELAGLARQGAKPVDDLIPDFDFDFEIPGLDMTWWVPIQKKINEITAIQGKLLAKVQNLTKLVDIDPDNDVCKYVPDAQKLMNIIREIQRVLIAIQKIAQAVRTIVNTIKRVIKILERIPKIGTAIKLSQVYLFIKQIISGFEIIFKIMIQNLTDTNKLIPQLLAALASIIAQCAMSRGLDSGLSKEECEKLGGVWVDRRLGDMGDAGGGDGNDVFRKFINELSEDTAMYLRPGLGLNVGDEITSGCVVGPDGTVYNAPFTIPAEGYTVCDDGASGESEAAVLNQQELEAIINSQLVDLTDCLTKLEDYEKTSTYR